MTAGGLPRPGIVYGPYPQRLDAADPWWLVLADGLGDRLSPGAWASSTKKPPFMQRLRPALATEQEDSDDLKARASMAARLLLREGFSDAAVAQAQVVIACAVHKVLGYRPYLTQHAAAYELVQDRVVEMDTGEGKSIAILMAAATAALARVPVHVITVNDYLAERDALLAGRILAELGLSAGAVCRPMKPDERRIAYTRDVVYVTAQEVGFDYLRDRMQEWQSQHGMPATPILRGLCLALVDEVDSILLDHARTPLILAAEVPATASVETMQSVYAYSQGLRQGRDFSLERDSRRVEVEPAVVRQLAHHLAQRRLGLADVREVRSLLVQALVARHALRRDVQYVVDDGEVVIVDETTGRTMPDSVWSNGLHAMASVKEGLEPPPHTRTCGQITLQTLLGRYCKIGGISGTLRDARAQLWFLYGLTVRRVEPRVPNQGRHLGLRLCASRIDQFDAVARTIRTMKHAGRAVLVGTDSVAAAEALSRHLQAARIEHSVLTARDDEREAELIAQAGARGAVTVSTNVAGRGTHIELHADVVAAGGLHVICCTQNGSPRIDRQLFGRAARNGQPGSHEVLLCLEDPLFVNFLPKAVIQLLTATLDKEHVLPKPVGRLVARWVQSMSVWNQFYRSWQALQHARKSRDALLRLPNME